MTRTTLWWENVCTWMWMEVGGELTVKLCCQELCVMFPHQVSVTYVDHENPASLQLLAYCYWLCDNTYHFLPSSWSLFSGNKQFTSYEVACPTTWVKFGHSCYNFEPVVQKLTFEESREHCRQKGMDSFCCLGNNNIVRNKLNSWLLLHFNLLARMHSRHLVLTTSLSREYLIRLSNNTIKRFFPKCQTIPLNCWVQYFEFALLPLPSQHFRCPDRWEWDRESFCSGAAVVIRVPAPDCVVGDVLQHWQ